MRRWSVGLAVAAVLAMAPIAGAAPVNPCKRACVHLFKGQPKRQSWTSDYLLRGDVQIAVSVRGRGLKPELIYSKGEPCIVRYRGKGVRLRANMCDEPSPLEVNYRAKERRTIALVIITN